MKSIILVLLVLIVAGCASVPKDMEGRRALYVRVCNGEIANQQGVVLGQRTPEQGRAYAMHECLYRHGIR